MLALVKSRHCGKTRRCLLLDLEIEGEFTRAPGKFDYAFFPRDKKALLQRKEELVMTQFMKLLVI